MFRSPESVAAERDRDSCTSILAADASPGPSTLDRIASLAIPPAWSDVWICPDDRGHIQATGRDAKGRKQYRYHERWHELRSSAKFDSLLEFGRALPKLHAQIDRDMRCRSLSFDRVVATTVWLLDHTLIRIGNTEYSDSSYRPHDPSKQTCPRNNHGVETSLRRKVGAPPRRDRS